MGSQAGFYPAAFPNHFAKLIGDNHTKINAHADSGKIARKKFLCPLDYGLPPLGAEITREIRLRADKHLGAGGAWSAVSREPGSPGNPPGVKEGNTLGGDHGQRKAGSAGGPRACDW